MFLSLSFKGQEVNSTHGHREERAFQEVMLGLTSDPFILVPDYGRKRVNLIIFTKGKPEVSML